MSRVCRGLEMVASIFTTAIAEVEETRRPRQFSAHFTALTKYNPAFSCENGTACCSQERAKSSSY